MKNYWNFPLWLTLAPGSEHIFFHFDLGGEGKGGLPSVENSYLFLPTVSLIQIQAFVSIGKIWIYFVCTGRSAEAVFHCVPCFICYKIKIIIKANYIQWNDISRNISVSAPQRTEQEYEYSILLVKHYWISWALFTFHHLPGQSGPPASPFKLIARNGCRNCKQTELNKLAREGKIDFPDPCVSMCVAQCDENKNLNRNINRNTGRFIVGRRAELRSTMSLQLVLSSVTNHHYYPGLHLASPRIDL